MMNQDFAVEALLSLTPKVTSTRLEELDEDILQWLHENSTPRQHQLLTPVTQQQNNNNSTTTTQGFTWADVLNMEDDFLLDTPSPSPDPSRLPIPDLLRINSVSSIPTGVTLSSLDILINDQSTSKTTPKNGGNVKKSITTTTATSASSSKRTPAKPPVVVEDEVPLSPRSHAIREKNREAVRKCRAKKREEADVLQERINAMELENAHLKQQKALGSLERLKEIEEETLNLANTIKGLLVSDPNEELKSMVTSYLERSREKGIDRATALTDTLDRLLGIIEPSNDVKLYLLYSYFPNSFFEDGKMWKVFKDFLQLSDAQVAALMGRRAQLRDLRNAMLTCVADIKSLKVEIAKKEKVAIDSWFQKSIQGLLSPKQIAKLITWIKTNDKVVDITQGVTLSGFLEKVKIVKEEAMEDLNLNLFDGNEFEFSPKISTKLGYVVSALNEEQEEQAGRKKSPFDLLQERRKTIVKERLGELWSAPKEKLETFIRKFFSPDVTFFDLIVGERKSVNALLEHIYRIRLAFDGLSCSFLDNLFSLDKNSSTGAWLVVGNDRKTQRKIAFNMVLKFGFMPDSEVIQHVFLSWDSMSMMLQRGDFVKAPTPSHKLDVVQKGEIAQTLPVIAQTLSKLALIFSSDLPPIGISNISSQIFLPNVSFQDSFMGYSLKGVSEFDKYATKFKKRFLKFKITPEVTKKESAMNNVHSMQVDWKISGSILSPVKQVIDFETTALVFVILKGDKIESVLFSWKMEGLLVKLGLTKKV